LPFEKSRFFVNFAQVQPNYRGTLFPELGCHGIVDNEAGRTLKTEYRGPRFRSNSVSFIKERLALVVDGRRQAHKLVWSIASAENTNLSLRELTVICVNLRNQRQKNLLVTA